MIGVTKFGRFGRFGELDGGGGSPSAAAAAAPAAAAALAAVAALAAAAASAAALVPEGFPTAAAVTIAATAVSVFVGGGSTFLASGRVTSVPASRTGSSLPITLPGRGKSTPVPVVRRRLPPRPINPFVFVRLGDRVRLLLWVILMLKGLKLIGDRLRYWTRVNKSRSYFN